MCDACECFAEVADYGDADLKAEASGAAAGSDCGFGCGL